LSPKSKLPAVAMVVVLALALATLAGCSLAPRGIPAPSGEQAPVMLPPIEVVNISDMATTAVRVDERSSTSRTRTLAQPGHHYYDVILSVPVSMIDGPRASRPETPDLIVDDSSFPAIDSVVIQRPGRTVVHLIAEFEIPLGSAPGTISVPFSGAGDAPVVLPLR
jgi:hypothetical protein